MPECCGTSMSFVRDEPVLRAPSAGHAYKAAGNHPIAAAVLGTIAAGAGAYNFFFIKEIYRCQKCGYVKEITRKKRF